MKVSKFKRYTYFLTGSEEVKIGLITFEAARQRLLGSNVAGLISEENFHERSFRFGSRFGEWLDKEWLEEVEPTAAKQTDFQVLEKRFLSKLQSGQNFIFSDGQKFNLVTFLNSDRDTVHFVFNKDGSFRQVE